MKIALAQLNPIIGDFEGNLVIIQKAYAQAKADGARILLTPELSVCGYPPHDLVERAEIFDHCDKSLQKLCQLTENSNTALVLGLVSRNTSTRGRGAFNQVVVLDKGKVVFSQNKSLLPTYDVFDEARYFEPSQERSLWVCDGKKIALAICEDLWGGDPAHGRDIYGKDLQKTLKEQAPDLLISISASPYEWKKRELREELHQKIAKELNTPLIYVNQVGATDEILFDGGSFFVHPSGAVGGRLFRFSEKYGLIQWSNDLSILSGDWVEQIESEIGLLNKALVFGIKEYFKRTHFDRCLIGLSGGIDSALVAVLAVQALGKDRVIGVAMPSQNSSAHSLADAEALAKNLQIRFLVRPIKFLYSTAKREISQNSEPLSPIADENLQSRLRGIVLMTLANHTNALVLTTGNKSEIAMGYCTLYGDMCGALAPIGDLFKTRVYELAKYLNSEMGGLIPVNSIEKAPSAELRPDQKDEDSLPPYPILDQVLEAFIEKKATRSELESAFPSMLRAGPGKTILDVLNKVELSEYKRKQAAPVLKVSSKAFGIGRRIPIAKIWNH